MKFNYFPSLIPIYICLLANISQVSADCGSRPTLKLYSGYSSYGQGHLQEAVKVCQGLLNQKGGYGLQVDGYFGASTDQAVRNWQIKNSLTVDGVVGTNTWASLCGTSLNNPYYEAPRGSTQRWNPICKYVVDKLNEKFPSKLSCGTYISPSSSSDHPGNAADCFPGKSGVAASGQDLTDGNAAAEWLRQNAGALKVRYIIWQNKIWNIRRASEGWRNYGRSGVTEGHYDHVHLSVNSALN